MAEQDDLPSGPCNTGVTLVRVARCVEGVWQLGWANPEELASATAVALSPILAAVEKGWPPAKVVELAQVLKGKGCG